MVTFRRYSPLSGDFERMRLFLQENCGSHGEKGRYPEFWEYAQVLPWYDYASSWRNGIWEEDGRIVAAAWFARRASPQMRSTPDCLKRC